MRTLFGFVVSATFAVVAGCGGQAAQERVEVTTTTMVATTRTTTTTSSKPAIPFAASVHDVITQLNLQLPILLTEEPSTKLPVAMLRSGVFGGSVKPGVEVYLQSSGNAFSPLLAAVVRVTGVNGSVQTPARLLSGVGVSLHALASEVADAFRIDALPRLSTVARTRTTITVGTYYDLTVVVLDQSRISFVYTPIGVSPPPGVENLGP